MASLRISFRILPGLLIIVFAMTVQAQSGRRQTKPPPAAPVPTPTPEPTPKPKEEPKSDLAFLVGIDRSESFSYNPLTFYTIVRNGCADRLRKESAANVSTADHMTRSDAIKKAKAEKTTYVVLLRLVGQFRGGSRTIDEDEIVIEFVVFEPVTAKIKVNGRSYQNAARAGPIVVQPPGGRSGSILYTEQLLRRAAEDAADRILNSLHLRARR